MPESDNTRTKIAEVLKNGVGTIITRSIVIFMPIMFSGAVWAGKVIVELNVEKITDALARVEKHLDKVDAIDDAQDVRIERLDRRVTRNEVRLDERKP